MEEEENIKRKKEEESKAITGARRKAINVNHNLFKGLTNILKSNRRSDSNRESPFRRLSEHIQSTLPNDSITSIDSGCRGFEPSRNGGGNDSFDKSSKEHKSHSALHESTQSRDKCADNKFISNKNCNQNDSEKTVFRGSEDKIAHHTTIQNRYSKENDVRENGDRVVRSTPHSRLPQVNASSNSQMKVFQKANDLSDKVYEIMCHNDAYPKNNSSHCENRRKEQRSGFPREKHFFYKSNESKESPVGLKSNYHPDEEFDSSYVIAELSNNRPAKTKHFELKGDNISLTVTFDSNQKNEKGASTNEVQSDSFENYIIQKLQPIDPVVNSSELYSINIAESNELFIPPPTPPSPQSKIAYLTPENTSDYVSSSEMGDTPEIKSKCNKSFVEKSSFVPEPCQIDAISSYLQRIESESSKASSIAKRVRDDVYNVVRYYFTGNKVILYGSYLSDLAVNTSNINLALDANQSPNDSFMINLRKRLYEKMEGYYVETFEPAANPRLGKICFSDNECGITCELVYQRKTVEHAMKMNFLLKNIVREKTVKTLIIATRIWAENNSINEAEIGKLHTVGFSLMVLYFCQQMQNPMLPAIDITLELDQLQELQHNNNKETVGKLWLDFLKFYSEEFDWKNDVVCITKIEKVSKKEKSWENFWIAIEDPFTNRNIASSVVNEEVANFIHNCFTKEYENCLSPKIDVDSDSFEDNFTDCKDSESVKWEYSFRSCQLDLPTCEDCDELGGPCENCYTLDLPPLVEKIPEVCEESLKYVDEVLNTVYEKNILSVKQLDGRKAFLRDMEEFVRHRFQDAYMSLFGSSVNGFGFESSDLDICLTFKNKLRAVNEQETRQILHNLCTHLRRNNRGKYKDIIALYMAKIPLVKLSSVVMDWKCDISLYNILAVHNSKLLNIYANFDERCRKLGCAMKLLAKKTGIADCVSKTLSSYSYILMTIHYLQQVEPPVLPVLKLFNTQIFKTHLFIPQHILKENIWLSESEQYLKKKYKPICTNTSDIGRLWLGLLEFYLQYDLKRAVSIVQKEPLHASELQRSARLFNIQDPFLQKRNLGCIVSESKAHEIMRIFRQARILFGKEKPKDVIDLKNHYFSTQNLTGQYRKDLDCSLCGVYGHDKRNCRK